VPGWFCEDVSSQLKFERDRRRWKYWLFQARKRFGLSVLNYIVTSNHIHLLVRDTTHGTISRSLQLIAGRVGQEYNRRKSRTGAFWEDRYFATAVSTDQHLFQCLVYIDLNMVRAGVVSHPSEWSVCGYNEIQKPPLRYLIIDHDAMCALGGFGDMSAFRRQHLTWITDALNDDNLFRESKWTEAVAVGPDPFTSKFQDRS